MKVLVMEFITSSGTKATIRFNHIKETLDEETVSAVMDKIIAKNIFFTKGGELRSKDSARIVQTITEDLVI